MMVYNRELPPKVVYTWIQLRGVPGLPVLRGLAVLLRFYLVILNQIADQASICSLQVGLLETYATIKPVQYLITLKAGRVCGAYRRVRGIGPLTEIPDESMFNWIQMNVSNEVEEVLI
jgi:hypothetical protein